MWGGAVISLVVTLTASGGASAEVVAPVLSGRLTPELFLNEEFVAYTDLWGVAGSEGDPIIFKVDGTVENARAGLRGRWQIVDDATLAINDRKFTFSARHRSLFSPLEPGSEVGYYILLRSDSQKWWQDRSKPN